MSKCWANVLGACSDKISREHYVSQALWTGPSVTVQGFSWCKEKPAAIGLGSLTSKILCTYHNGALSDLDAAAGDAFATIRNAVDLANQRAGTPAKKHKRVGFGINGPLLERWFVKTAINIANVSDTKERWYFDKSPLGAPSAALASLAFEPGLIKRPMGLYAAGSVGGQIGFVDGLEAAPLYYFDQGAAGFVFRFFGISFLLWLSNPGPPPELALPWGMNETVASQHVLYHLAFLRWATGAKTSHYIGFGWPKTRPPAWLSAT